MQLLDGFIVGIYDYCDRWCETCAFTSRCRVFATNAEVSATLDPQFPAVGVGLLRSTAALAANLDAMDPPDGTCHDDEDDEDEDLGGMFEADVAQVLASMEDEEEREHIPEAHLELGARAEDYLRRAGRWLDANPPPARGDASQPQAVIVWFHMMIAVKIDRALRGVREAAAGDAFGADDAAGSGKVALLGIERSHAAWLTLLARGEASPADVDPLIADLVHLGEALERIVPRVRTFVRPAFDEPDAVARLEAAEASRGG